MSARLLGRRRGAGWSDILSKGMSMAAKYGPQALDLASKYAPQALDLASSHIDKLGLPSRYTDLARKGLGAASDLAARYRRR